MKKTVLKYGLYSLYTMLALFLIFSFVYGENYKTQEIVTWTGIVLSVIFVYFGLKYYRDKENGGALGFGEGLKLGLLIVLFPSIAFGLYNVIYIEWLNPQFLDNYYAYQVAEVKANVPAAEVDKQLKEIQDMRQMFANPAVQFVVMFLSVFVIGLIVTVISTLMLKRKAPQPVRA